MAACFLSWWFLGFWLPLCSIEKLPTRHTGGEDILRPEGLWEVCPSDHRVSQSVRVIRASLWQRILPPRRKLRFNSWVWKIHLRRNRLPTPVFLGFPYGSAGKESACNTGDLGSVPRMGRSPGEGKGYPLQYSGLKKSMGSQRVRQNWVTFTFLPKIINLEIFFNWSLWILISSVF